MVIRNSWWAAMLVAALACADLACGGGNHGGGSGGGDVDPPEVQIGERLFLETRFAQFFFAHSNGDPNAVLAEGDPVMDSSVTTGGPLPGPFRGESMNCRSCHLVDELQNEAQGGVRTYGDFARQSPIPARADGLSATPRNSPPLVNSTLSRDVPLVLHFDGEFSSIEGLVEGTLTGRNFGWLPTESDTALAHIATVVRGDDGTGELASDYSSLPYHVLLQGTDTSIPKTLRLPAAYRIDVASATDEQVLAAVTKLIGAYVDSLRFATDADDNNNGSPYDLFLSKNALPRRPADGESAAAYSARLLGLIDRLEKPRFVTPKDGKFDLHDQAFQFGATERAGLKIFFATAEPNGGGSIGNCVSCHPAPSFTDFRFHNTGASQFEYDSIHEAGAFAALDVPGLAMRSASFDAYLPPSPAHPSASGRFRSQPASDKPGYTDLGLWNVLGNPDIPNPQTAIAQILCTELQREPATCTAEALLPLALGVFKTPTLRDLGQSQPYLHSGQMDAIEDVLSFYLSVSALAHNGLLRNGASELAVMAIGDSDVVPLAAFLRSLNEDYS